MHISGGLAMAIDAYITRAASELRNAAGVLQDEIHELQRGVYDKQVSLKHEATDIDYRSTSLKIEDAGSNDKNRRHEPAARREVLKRTADEKRKEADKRGSD